MHFNDWSLNGANRVSQSDRSVTISARIEDDAFIIIPSLVQFIDFPQQEDSVYILRDIVSRKKQLIPLLSEQIEKLLEK